MGVPGLQIPATWPVDRATLGAIAGGTHPISDAFPGCRLPVILRPLDSHGGHGLARIDSLAEIDAYLATEADTHFYLSNFIDYSGPDGLFRKLRVALIDGRPFACHMGVSSHWMIHYVNAGMYEDAAKRGRGAGSSVKASPASQRAMPRRWPPFTSAHTWTTCASTAPKPVTESC